MGIETSAGTGYMAQNNIDIQGMAVGGGTAAAGSTWSGGSLLSAFGSGMSATSAYTQAKNQQAALNAEAQVQANNAILAGWQADDAIARGDLAAVQQTIKGGQIKGTQRASLAANGVDLSVGSAQAVMNDTDFITAVDAAQIRDNAAREAWGYRQTAKAYMDKSAAARSGAGSISPWLSAGTSLLTSATNVASRWYQTSARGG
jgi:hypothetical protein